MNNLTLNREYLLGKKVKISSLSDFHIVAGKCYLLGLEMATWRSCSYKYERSYGVFIGRQGLFLCVSEGDWDGDEDDAPDYYDLEEIDISLFKEQPPVNKTKRTRIEYVKCEFEHAWQVVKVIEEGETLFRDSGGNDVITIREAITRFITSGKFYQRTKVEIDWLDEVVDSIGSGLLKRNGDGFQIGGVFVSSEEMVKIAQTVLNCRGEEL